LNTKPNHKRNKKKIKSSASDLAKSAIDASKIIVGAVAVKAADEIVKHLNYPERPKNQSRREFARKRKPTKTYTQAARWLKQEKNQLNRNIQQNDTTILRPGIDGLISFSILLAPFTIFLGLLFISGVEEIFLIIILTLYVLLIAIPGSYLGLDAIFYGGKTFVAEGGRTFWAMIVIFWRGLVELFYIFTNLITQIFRETFREAQEYWVFTFVYIGSALSLWVFFSQVISFSSITAIILFVVIPALLPASLLHGLWTNYLWKKKIKINKNH